MFYAVLVSLLESVDVLLKHCDVDILVAHLFELFLIGKGIHGGISQYGDYWYKTLRSDYIHFIISI